MLCYAMNKHQPWDSVETERLLFFVGGDQTQDSGLASAGSVIELHCQLGWGDAGSVSQNTFSKQ